MHRYEIKMFAKFGIIIPITLMRVMIVKLKAPATKNVTENFKKDIYQKESQPIIFDFHYFTSKEGCS